MNFLDRFINWMNGKDVNHYVVPPKNTIAYSKHMADNARRMNELARKAEDRQTRAPMERAAKP